MTHRLCRPVIALLMLLAGAAAGANTGNCSGNPIPSNLANPVVELRTSEGSVCIEVLADQAPQTAANFLAYLRNGDIDGTFFHRAVAGFVLQGGGFRVGAGDDRIVDAAALPPVDNEPCALDQLVPGSNPPAPRCSVRGNVRGTLAMAKLGGQPDSATNQWFFNLADNRANLDNQNGGFTVFARVLGDGMAVVDRIMALPLLPYAQYGLDIAPVRRLSAFTTLPVSQVPAEPPGGFGCFSVDDLAVTFADARNPDSNGDGVPDSGCPANKLGFTDDACERGTEIPDDAEPSGLQVVSGACGTALDRPEHFSGIPDIAGGCSQPDCFAWGVRETGGGRLAFAGRSVVYPGGTEPVSVKIPYRLTPAQIAESDARRAERRSVMMQVTAPLLVYVDRAVLSPEIVGPAPGATLDGPQQTFTWDPHDTPADAWALWFGSTPGGQQYGAHHISDPTATSAVVAGLPYSGETVHATLWWRVNGRWAPANSRRHTFIAADLDDPALTSPVNLDTLPGYSVSFDWQSNGVPADAWALWFGSTPGGREHGTVLSEDPAATSLTFDGLPFAGETVHATLYWRVSGRWFSRPYQFTAATLPLPELTGPESDADGDAVIDPALPEPLAGPGATFTWDDHGLPVEDHAVWFGSTPGGLQYGYAWASAVNGTAPASVTSLTFDGLPYAGETVYVTFYWKIRGTWHSRPYLFTAASLATPELTGPESDGDGDTVIDPLLPETLPGTSATFTWDAHGVPLDDVAIWFGTTPGGRQYGFAWASQVNRTAPGTVTSLGFDRLPFAGEAVHVTFYWKVRGAWHSRPYRFTAVDLPRPQLTSHADGDTLAGASAVFTWDVHGLAVEDMALWFGTRAGGAQFGYAWVLDPRNPLDLTTTSSLTFDRLPFDGETVYATLWWKVYGTWHSRPYRFTAADLPDPDLTPGAGATLTGGTQLFSWDDNGVPAEDHAVWFGSSRGAMDIGYVWAAREAPADPAAVTGLTFDRLPTDGRTLHVTFWWKTRGVWRSRHYEMTAHRAP